MSNSRYRRYVLLTPRRARPMLRVHPRDRFDKGDSVTDYPDGVPIGVAAQALGVSDKTIRRRIAAKQLDAHRVYTSQGYEWRVHLPGQVLSTHAVQAESPASTQPDQSVARLDNTRLRAVVRELQRTRERVAQLEAERPEYGPRDPGAPVVLAREDYPTGDTSHVAGDTAQPRGLVARLRAWWGGGA